MQCCSGIACHCHTMHDSPVSFNLKSFAKFFEKISFSSLVEILLSDAFKNAVLFLQKYIDDAHQSDFLSNTQFLFMMHCFPDIVFAHDTNWDIIKAASMKREVANVIVLWSIFCESQPHSGEMREIGRLFSMNLHVIMQTVKKYIEECVASSSAIVDKQIKLAAEIQNILSQDMEARAGLERYVDCFYKRQVERLLNFAFCLRYSCF